MTTMISGLSQLSLGSYGNRLGSLKLKIIPPTPMVSPVLLSMVPSTVPLLPALQPSFNNLPIANTKPMVGTMVTPGSSPSLVPMTDINTTDSKLSMTDIKLVPRAIKFTQPKKLDFTLGPLKVNQITTEKRQQVESRAYPDCSRILPFIPRDFLSLLELEAKTEGLDLIELIDDRCNRIGCYYQEDKLVITTLYNKSRVNDFYTYATLPGVWVVYAVEFTAMTHYLVIHEDHENFATSPSTDSKTDQPYKFIAVDILRYASYISFYNWRTVKDWDRNTISIDNLHRRAVRPYGLHFDTHGDGYDGITLITLPATSNHPDRVVGYYVC